MLWSPQLAAAHWGQGGLYVCMYVCMYVSLIGDMHILHMYIMRVDRCCMYDNHV